MPDLSKLSNEELLKLDEQTRQANDAEVFAQASDKPEASPLQTALEQKIIARNDPGLLDTILRGAGNQFNLGFGPQVRSGIKTGFGLLGDYDKALEEDRAKYEGGKAAHPGAAIASEVGGAVGSAMLAPEFQFARAAPVVSGIGKLLPRAVPRITRATQPAATVGERLNRAATTGGIYGGISGVGNAQADNPADAALGGGIGAVAGAGLGAGLSGAFSALGAAGRTARGFVTNPDSEAMRRVTRALQQDRVSRDVAAGLPPKADEAVQEAQQQLGTAIDRGQPMVVADTGGEATRGLARSAANTSPVAREALQGATEPRFSDQAARTAGFLGESTGTTGDTTAVRESLQAAARRANRPAYQRAYAEGERGVWNEQLQGLTAAPAVQDAMRGAVKTGANKAAADGFRPPRNPFIQGNDGTLVLPGDGTRPTLQFWDHVKRNLDDAITAAQRKGENSHAGDLRDLRTSLLQQLDAAAPSYRGARQGAAGFFGMDDALDVGTHLAGNFQMPINDVARGLSGMNEAERRLVREGYVNEVMNKLGQAGDQRDVTIMKVFASPAGRERSRMILGSDQADRLEDFMHVENIMNRTRRAVAGNSTTARQLVELGVAGGAGMYASGGDYTDPSTYLTAGLLLGGKYVGKKIDQRVVERVGRLLASSDPQQLNQGLRIVARNQSLREALRYAEPALQRAAVTNPEVQQGLQQ